MRVPFLPLAVGFSALALGALLAQASSASPYGGMSIEWSEVGSANRAVRIEMEVLLDGAELGFGPSHVGTTVPAWDGLRLDFGDGVSQGPLGWSMRIVKHDPDTGFVVARIIGIDGAAGVLHTYPGPWQASGEPWPATLHADARRLAADGHANNPGSPATVTTGVAMGSVKPEASVEPPQPRIVRCPVDARCAFDMEGRTATNGPSLVHLSSAVRADGVGAFRQPGPPTGMYPATVGRYGNVTWDTTGAGASTFHSMHLTHAYDIDGLYFSAAVDFLIFVDPTIPVPPEPPVPRGQVGVDFLPPSPCDDVQRTAVGVPVAFAVTAEADTDGHDTSLTAWPFAGLDVDPPPSGPRPETEARWTPAMPGAWHAAFFASTPGNATADGAMAECLVPLEAFELQAQARTYIVEGPTGQRILLEDASQVPDGVTVVGRQWRTPAGTLGGDATHVDLGAGRHHLCLVLTATFEGHPLEATDCVSVSTGPGTPDGDGDGFSDAVDNCADAANRFQQDADSDGRGDACDPVHEPMGPTPARGVDTDGDGLMDAEDLCPTIGDALAQMDLDRDGRGDSCDLDMDGDGITNVADNCPTVPNPDQRDGDRVHGGDVCDRAWLGIAAPASVGRSHPVVDVGEPAAQGHTWRLGWALSGAVGMLVTAGSAWAWKRR